VFVPESQEKLAMSRLSEIFGRRVKGRVTKPGKAIVTNGVQSLPKADREAAEGVAELLGATSPAVG
jgi:hypothetical protein